MKSSDVTDSLVLHRAYLRNKKTDKIQLYFDSNLNIQDVLSTYLQGNRSLAGKSRVIKLPSSI